MDAAYGLTATHFSHSGRQELVSWPSSLGPKNKPDIKMEIRLQNSLFRDV